MNIIKPTTRVLALLAAVCLGASQTPAQEQAWREQMPSALQEMEYRFNRLTDGAIGAPNRSQGLRSRLEKNGIEVFPRSTGASGQAAPWKLQLRTSAFGRIGHLQELGAGSPSFDSERAQLQHGVLMEWFRNDQRGIEQGWSLGERPAGTRSLVIRVKVAGDLRPLVEADGQHAHFLNNKGETILNYGGLSAWDANGRTLQVRMQKAPGGLEILLDDHEAHYPVHIDPIITAAVWSLESNQVGARFGFSVAAAGDVNGDGFDDVIVGAREFDAGELDEGRAFVYHGSASGLASTPAWTMESNQAGAFFGTAVSGAGDVNADGFYDVIIGSSRFTNGESGEGSAFLYLGSASGLSSSADWSAESDQDCALFGNSVSSAGDVNGDGFDDVIVGASGFDNGESSEGRAFVYLGSLTGLGSSEVWNAESNQAGAQFGGSVSGAGDVNGDGFDDVIVGAFLFANGEFREGSAFLFHGSATGPSTMADWSAESDEAFAWFGWSVSDAGDVNGDGFGDVIVGSRLQSNGQSDEGLVYVYHGSAAGLSTLADWVVESDFANAELGSAVSSAGDFDGDGFDDVLVGAPGFSASLNPREGAAFVYYGSATGLESSAGWIALGDAPWLLLGSSLSSAGDVNGDGRSDVIIGAPFANQGEFEEGLVRVYHGFDNTSASSSFFNGSGSNLNCFNSLPPVLGQNWISTVGTSAHPGAAFSFFVVRANSSSGFFISGGELLLDITSSLFISMSAPAVGPSTVYTVAIPFDSSLAGLSASAQGFIFGGGTRTLCNGYTFVVGF